MKKRNEIIIFSVFLCAALVSSLLYVVNREKALRRMKSETEDLYRQPAGQEGAGLPANLALMFPDKPGIAPFADSLALYAQKAGVRNLEVQTVEQKGTGRPGRGAKAGKGSAMRAHVIKVAMEGSYRSIAEYIRLVQNSERFCRLTELDIRPGRELLKAGMTLEIYSIGGRDAS
ncbi:MAG: hypothetical protein M0024_14475 [Nitrospiraceae bacterium]|nr:hypothetical protein [Nitrospiraceae bacterium]